MKLILFLVAALFSFGSLAQPVQRTFFTTNTYPQLMPIRVSSMGIANGTSTNRNAGADFGPDTPGTTTSGIQEALNSIPIGTNQGPYMAPITIQLDPGNFFYTNVIYYSNSYTAGIEIAGAGMLNTTLIYSGAATVSNCISITGGAHTGGALNLPFHVTVRDATMTALTQATNVLLYISGSSYTRIADMNFTGWNVRTNTDSGAAVSMLPTAAAIPSGLVGFRINNSLDHSTVIDNIFFAGLAVGARIKSDHPVGYNLKFANISYGALPGPVTITTNIWPTNAIYNIGAGIILEDNVYDSRWFYGHAYAMRCAFANVGGNIVSPTLYGWHFESAQYPIVSDTELVPILVDPVSTSGASSDFNQYILFTPTSANYPTNRYEITSVDHPFGYQRGSGRVDGGDFGFWTRRENSFKMVLDGTADYLTVDGQGVSDLRAENITALGADPNADRGVFWDDSAGALKYFTFGSGLTMTDTTLTSSGGAGFWVADAGPLGGYTNLYGARWTSSGGEPVLYWDDDTTYIGNAGTTVSRLGPFFISTTGADLYWIGKINGSVAEGDANLNDVTVNSLTGAGTGGGSLTLQQADGDNTITLTGETGVAGFAGTIYPTNLTASRIVLTDANKGLVSAAATSDATPINRDGTATTAAQIGGMFSGGSDYLKADGTTGTGGSGPKVYTFRGWGSSQIALNSNSEKYATLVFSGYAPQTTEAPCRVGIPVQAPYTITNFVWGLQAQTLAATTNCSLVVYSNGVAAGTRYIYPIQGSASTTTFLTNDTGYGFYIGGTAWTNVFSIGVSNGASSGTVNYAVPWWSFQVIKE